MAELAQLYERAQAELGERLERDPIWFDRCPYCHDAGIVYAWFLIGPEPETEQQRLEREAKKRKPEAPYWAEVWGVCSCREPDPEIRA